MKRGKARTRVDPDPGYRTTNFPETPLTNELLTKFVRGPDCPPLLRKVLQKQIHELTLEEHVSFSGMLLGLCEMALNGELDGFGEESEVPPHHDRPKRSPGRIRH